MAADGRLFSHRVLDHRAVTNTGMQQGGVGSDRTIFTNGSLAAQVRVRIQDCVLPDRYVHFDCNRIRVKKADACQHPLPVHPCTHCPLTIRQVHPVVDTQALGGILQHH